MNYNNTTQTTTESCVNPGAGYCLEWSKQTITTYNWFDTIILFMIPITILFVIGLFKPKK